MKNTFWDLSFRPSCIQLRCCSFLIFFIGITQCVQAQISSAPTLFWDDFVSEYFTQSDPLDDEMQSNEEIEWLENFSQHPLQVNRTTREELLALPFLNAAQVDSLLSYRDKKYGIYSLGELQLISGWDYYTRRFFSLFVRFDSLYVSPKEAERFQSVTLRQKMILGRHEIESRLDVPLYQRHGYKEPQHPTTTNYYLGNPLNHIVRYRYHYKKEVAYGLTMAKDAGEPVGKQGFYPYDYLSGYFICRPREKSWSFVLGDYEINDRLGLLFGRDYFAGREQFLRSLSSRPMHFRPHTSGNEYRFFRGGAFAWHKRNWKVLGFASYRKMDARWSKTGDTVRNIQTTGLHRTLSEINRRRSLGVWTGGGHLGWHGTYFGIGLNGYYTRYGSIVFPEWRKYNIYYFRGIQAGGVALSSYYRHRCFEWQGEVAFDHKFHWAMVHTAKYQFSSRLSTHLQYRQFTPRFVSIYGNCIQQNGRVANEQGVLLGVRYLPKPRWELTAYSDFFQFIKPTYRSILDHAKGMELNVRSRSPLTFRSILNVRYRMKLRQQTISGHKQLEYRQTHRLQVSAVWTWKMFELHSQMDGTYAYHQTGKQSKGAMCSVRTKWKPSRHFQLKNFLGYHWTDDYEAAVYVYEPQMLHAGASSPFVIKNFSLTVKKGSVIALVGESGCGKSTLIKLMLGFYIPQKGCLFLGNYNVRDVDHQDWLKHCGVVMQETKIFSGTIIENISFSEEQPNMDKVLAVLKTVGLSSFIETLPMGIHTKIGVSGIEMSGGQKQRLMIARALYKNPDILFLDEATSSLDANNERLIVTNIGNLGKDKTIIIAAHRLSTVQNADKIVFVKHGEISEMGTHNELISLKGDYWKLVKNQLQLSV